jgi:vacuolar protein sorting-associated protein 35
MAVDDQDRLLDEATAVVREQAHYMERAIENDNLRESLKHASNIICELRTSLLSPKNYYQLYMMVFQELQRLAHFFDGKTHKRKMSELYESVQHAGNVLPRLYLLVTVGACYIKSREAHATDILRDLCELCKGVQHPTRGLFLRYYLSQMVKDKLPDTSTEYMDEHSFVEDSVDFIIDNFTESNRLWVRINHTGAGKDKTRREKERKDLRVLVGANLVRLSNMDGLVESWTARDGTVVDPHDYYCTNVLPRVLAQVDEKLHKENIRLQSDMRDEIL